MAITVDNKVDFVAGSTGVDSLPSDIAIGSFYIDTANQKLYLKTADATYIQLGGNIEWIDK